MATPGDTFNSTGKAVHPIRQVLVERALLEADAVETEYLLVLFDFGYPDCNYQYQQLYGRHSFVVHSRVEGLVALYDYYNEHFVSSSRYDRYKQLAESYAAGDIRTGSEMTAPIVTAACDTFYWLYDPGYDGREGWEGWLMHLRSDREVHRVPELVSPAIKRSR